jgi:hypothetical protein
MRILVRITNLSRLHQGKCWFKGGSTLSFFVGLDLPTERHLNRWYAQPCPGRRRLVQSSACGVPVLLDMYNSVCFAMYLFHVHVAFGFRGYCVAPRRRSCDKIGVLTAYAGSSDLVPALSLDPLSHIYPTRTTMADVSSTYFYSCAQLHMKLSPIL